LAILVLKASQVTEATLVLALKALKDFKALQMQNLLKVL
jgi:hypothetical protein